jgi:hypothetical protein
MRHFGLDEANRLVPLLTATFERVRPLVAKLQEAEEGSPEYDALLAEVRGELQPIEEMGIEVKAADGLVDFRALLDGRTVFLCWKYPETEVAYWHELQAGYAGRRPIETRTEFSPSYLS